MFQEVDWSMMSKSVQETLYMVSISLILVVGIGLVMGVLLYMSQPDGLWPNKIVNRFLDVVVNISRAIPFLILLVLLVPFTKFIVGTMLGAKAAIPSLTISASPFYARMVVIALMEVDKGTIEASRAMGASKFQIMTKVLLPEALPAIISGIVVTAISLVGYTAIAGAIGAGGLGYVAYTYGYVRNKMDVVVVATLLILVIVLLTQAAGDMIVKRIDKR